MNIESIYKRFEHFPRWKQYLIWDCAYWAKFARENPGCEDYGRGRRDAARRHLKAIPDVL